MNNAEQISNRVEKPDKRLGAVFDVDGTLYDQRPLRCILLAHMALAMIVRPVRTLRAIRILRSYRKQLETLRASTEPITPTSQLEATATATGLPIATIAPHVRFWMDTLPLRFMGLLVRRNLRRLLRQWRTAGVTLGVYSDYPADEKLRSLGLREVFGAERTAWSGGMGSRKLKPDPKGFVAMAAKLGLEPGEVTYIGDRPELDANGARAAGMDAVIVRRDEFGPLRRLEARLRRAAGGESSPHCWACGSPITRALRPTTIRQAVDPDALRITSSDYGQTAALRQCRQCRFVFAESLPADDLVDLYRRMDDPTYQDTAPARRVQMRGLLETILRSCDRTQTRTLLDIGAGTGLLVAEARKLGLEAEGVEPSRWCVDTARRVNDVTLHCGTLDQCADRLGRYDVVGLIDVVEHVSDPIGLIRQAAAFVRPGGVLAIVTPDVASPTARLMGRWWWHHRIAHVCYFSRYSMRRALEALDLRVVADVAATWRFPVGYLCERLVRYLPIPPLPALLRWAARTPAIADRQITLDLKDSRTFIAKVGEKTE